MKIILTTFIILVFISLQIYSFILTLEYKNRKILQNNFYLFIDTTAGTHLPANGKPAPGSGGGASHHQPPRTGRHGHRTGAAIHPIPRHEKTRKLPNLQPAALRHTLPTGTQPNTLRLHRRDSTANKKTIDRCRSVLEIKH